MTRRLVHVIDDDDAIRVSLTLTLNLEGLPCVSWPSAEAFLASADHGGGGCAVLDLRMPGMDGLELHREMTARGSTIDVIMVTGHGDVASAVAALKGGAVDFIEKPYDADALVLKIKEVLDRQEGGYQASTVAKAKLARLSKRENQVFLGIVAGKSNKEIARDLDLSPRTVEMHRLHLMNRLEVRSVPELIRLAIEGGAG
jgi:two-component system response regulator FixJ